MNKYIYKIPDGFNDILWDECYSIVEIESKIRDIFRIYGYKEVDTPTVEYYDLFSGRIDALPQEEMIKLFDSKGRILSLRPDITVPIMRMAITKLENKGYPLRLSYFGNIFRNEEKGLLDFEYRQAGIEILGSDSKVADAEVIGTAIKSLKSAGLEDFRIDIGQVKLFKYLTAEIDDEDVLEEIRKAVANKDKYDLEKILSATHICDEKKEKILKLPWLFGSLEIMKDIESIFKDEYEKEAIEELKNLIEILKQWGYEKYISIDLGMVQRLNYYSGIIFRGYALECGFSILWGGRYDFLSQNYNKSICAVGCAIGVSRIIDIFKRKGELKSAPPTDFLITAKEERFEKIAFEIAEDMRRKGYIVENDIIQDEENIKEYCKVRGIRKVIKVLDYDIAMVYDLENENKVKHSIDNLKG